MVLPESRARAGAIGAPDDQDSARMGFSPGEPDMKSYVKIGLIALAALAIANRVAAARAIIGN